MLYKMDRNPDWNVFLNMMARVDGVCSWRHCAWCLANTWLLKEAKYTATQQCTHDTP